MSYVVVSLIALLVFSFHTVAQKLTIRYLIKDSLLFSFYYFLFAVIFLLPFLFLGKIDFLELKMLYPAIAAGVLRGITMFVYIWTLKRLDVTVISSMFNLRVVFSVLLEVVFIGTLFTSSQYLWIMVLFIAGIFLSMDESFSWKSFFNPVMLVFIGNMALLSIISIFANRGVNELGLLTFNFWHYVSAVLVLSVMIFVSKKNIYLPKKSLGVLAITSGMFMVGVMLETLALARSVTGAAAVLSLPASMLMAMIFSKFKPDLLEKHTWQVYAVRVASAAVMTMAVWQIVM